MLLAAAQSPAIRRCPSVDVAGPPFVRTSDAEVRAHTSIAYNIIS